MVLAANALSTKNREKDRELLRGRRTYGLFSSLPVGVVVTVAPVTFPPIATPPPVAWTPVGFPDGEGVTVTFLPIAVIFSPLGLLSYLLSKSKNARINTTSVAAIGSQRFLSVGATSRQELCGRISSTAALVSAATLPVGSRIVIAFKYVGTCSSGVLRAITGSTRLFGLRHF